MNEPIVRCRGLERTFVTGKVSVSALRGVDLEIGSGEFVSLAGPSGCGKTTLLNLMGGLDAPDRGEVMLGDKPLHALGRSELADVRLHHVGFVFQDYNLIPVLSARENVEFIMQLQGVDKATRRARADEVLAQVGLEGMGDRRPAELSGGQQQRVAVARAIASRPMLVLADEPTANLDSETSDQLMELLRQLNEDEGVTIVVASHDQRMIDFTRRKLRMLDGKMVKEAG